MSLNLSLMDLGTLLISLIVTAGAHLALKRWSEFSAVERNYFFYALVALSLGLVADFAVNDLLARVQSLGAPAAAAPTAPATMAALTFVSYTAVKLFIVVALVRLTWLLARNRRHIS
ncbi:MAG: hypothetical protein KF767_09400 [Bdellovibrionaceae bacterium]|nr:hypothetical protein [Pseudobdellovibrionaceae bacterium]